MTSAPLNASNSSFKKTPGVQSSTCTLSDTSKQKMGGCRKIAAKVWEVTKMILLFALGVVLYAANPVVFAISFVIGIVFSEKIQETMVKIKKIWDKNTAAVLLLIAAGAFIALQVTVGTATAIFSANVSANLIE